MSIKELITDLASEKYCDEDGDEFSIELLEGMTEEEVSEYASQFPNSYLPDDVREVLLTCSGFEFSANRFMLDTKGHIAFEDVFPHSVPLCADGPSNFWIVDINEQGKWKGIYYICHDPAVVVYQAKDIYEFLGQLKQYCKSPVDNVMNDVRQKHSFQAWENEVTELSKDEMPSALISAEGMDDLPAKFFLADLRKAQVGDGFAWGISGPNTQLIRLGEESIWVVEAKDRRGLFAKLFGR